MVNEIEADCSVDSRSLNKIMSIDDVKLGRMYKRSVVYNWTDKMADSILKDKVFVQIVMTMASLALIAVSFMILDTTKFIIVCIGLLCLSLVINQYENDRYAIYGPYKNDNINLQALPIRVVDKVKMSFNEASMLRPMIRLFNDVIPDKLDMDDDSDFQFSIKSAHSINSVIGDKDDLYSDAEVGRFIKIIAPLAISVENGTELDSNSYAVIDSKFGITKAIYSIL